MTTEQSLRSLDHFVTDIEILRGIHTDVRALACAVAQRLTRVLVDPTCLCEAHRQPGADHYRQHVLYVAPDGGFSIVSLVWKPGQKTPIHDHVSWCVVGVYQGNERETRYRLYEYQHEQFLVEVACDVATSGQTVALVPPDEDIHQVACVGSGTAISIHVYGADISKLGTSINHRFDDLSIHTDVGSALPVSWRDLYQKGKRAKTYGFPSS